MKLLDNILRKVCRRFIQKAISEFYQTRNEVEEKINSIDMRVTGELLPVNSVLQ